MKNFLHKKLFIQIQTKKEIKTIIENRGKSKIEEENRMK